MERPIEIGLGQLRVGAGNIELGALTGDLLGLNGAIDDSENLAFANPIARLDRYRDDPPTFTHRPDGHFAPRRKRAGRFDHAH